MTGLALGHVNLALAPAKVVEGQRQDISSAQTIGGDQKEDRIVVQAHQCGAIDSIEKRTHPFPRPGPRELFKAKHPRGIDVPVDICTEATGKRTKTHESSDMRDLVLEGGATVLVAEALEEVLDIAACHRLKSRRARIVPDIEKS